MIVIPCFKSVLRHPKVVLSRICAAYLCLIHEKLLETVPVYWAACFVSTTTHSGWLFKALVKLFVVMFDYYISHILYTAVTQFDRIFVKSLMISVMLRKVLYNKLHKDLSYICLDMATVWRETIELFLFVQSNRTWYLTETTIF